MDDLSPWLLDSRHGEAFAFFRKFFSDETAFLTGGAVRDFVQGRSAADVCDLDLMVVHSRVDVIFAELDSRFPHTRTLFGNRKYVVLGSNVDVFPSADVRGAVLPPDQAVGYLDLTASALLVDLQGGPVFDFIGGRVGAENHHGRPQVGGWTLGAIERVGLVRRLLGLVDRGVFVSADWALPLLALQSGLDAGVPGVAELRSRVLEMARSE